MISNFLTFLLDKNYYAFPVESIQEVLPYSEPVKIPCSSPYVEGIINSRESGIPVINLRKKFLLEQVEPNNKNLIIIVEIKSPTEENPNHISTFGGLCDSVQEVIEIDTSIICNPPKFGTEIPSEYVKGIIKKDDNFIMILDETKIFHEH